MTLDELKAMDDNFINGSQAAEVIGISKKTFYSIMRDMDFPVRKIGRCYKIPRKEFIKFLSCETEEDTIIKIRKREKSQNKN